MTVVRLQTDPIRVEELIRDVRSDGDGAIAVFVGTVRDSDQGRRVLRMEYHAYDEMARVEMERLEAAVRSRHDVRSIAAVHRLGSLEVGEASVAIVVAAPHRAAAFDACRDFIDSLKRTVPVWKKEFLEDGEVWVDPGA